MWKCSSIRPVPKKLEANTPNDFQPIAITSILCKTIDRVLAGYLTTSVHSMLDPLQFAYRSDRGTDDAVLTLLNTVTKHLMHAKGYVRDFSSAFNSMKTFIFLRRLSNVNINKSLILWIRDCLSCCTQRMCVNGSMSDVLTVSTDCQKRCVLSPVLLSYY